LALGKKNTRKPLIKPKQAVHLQELLVLMCVLMTVVHNTALKSFDNLPYYPPDNHHSSDDVYWRGEGGCSSPWGKWTERTATAWSAE